MRVEKVAVRMGEGSRSGSGVRGSVGMVRVQASVIHYDYESPHSGRGTSVCERLNFAPGVHGGEGEGYLGTF